MEIRWSHLRAEQLRLLAAAPEAIVVVPVAAMEQHGPHLPVMVDSLLCSAVAERGVRARDEAHDRRLERGRLLALVAAGARFGGAREREAGHERGQRGRRAALGERARRSGAQVGVGRRERAPEQLFSAGAAA